MRPDNLPRRQPALGKRLPGSKTHCRHYNAVAAPELGGDGWLRCPDCGREYHASNPTRSKWKGGL